MNKNYKVGDHVYIKYVHNDKIDRMKIYRIEEKDGITLYYDYQGYYTEANDVLDEESEEVKEYKKQHNYR